MNDLIERLRWLILEHSSGKYTVFAKKAGIPHSTLQNYMKGRTPHVDHLLRIHDVFKVDINWLLTGEGEPYAKDAAMRESLATRLVANSTAGNGATKASEQKQEIVDRDLLADTIRVVEEWLVSNERKLTPEKKAEVVMYLYEEYLEREEMPATATVERLLKLVA